MITRYDFSVDEINLGMYQSSRGDYVDYYDYEALEDQLKDLMYTAEEEFKHLQGKYDDLVYALGDLYKDA